MYVNEVLCGDKPFSGVVQVEREVLWNCCGLFGLQKKLMGLSPVGGVRFLGSSDTFVSFVFRRAAKAP